MSQHLITAIIADDERHARERLRDLLGEFDLFEIVAEASDGNEALALIVRHKPDVAFLDINMPGISVFTSLPSLQNPPLIVFQTAYSEYAAEAFSIDALDYLLKPIRPERLQKTVEKIHRLRQRTESQQNNHTETSSGVVPQITVKVADKSIVIAVEDIVRISFSNGFCHLYTSKKKLMSDRYLNYFEEKLVGGRFYRTSRTDIINLDHVTEIRKAFQGMYSVVLKNGMQVDMSRRRAQSLRRIIDF